MAFVTVLRLNPKIISLELGGECNRPRVLQVLFNKTSGHFIRERYTSPSDEGDQKSRSKKHCLSLNHMNSKMVIFLIIYWEVDHFKVYIKFE